MADQPQQTLAQRIKAKYPEYGDIPDADLEQKVLAKYPEYGDLPRTQAQAAAPASQPGPVSRFLSNLWEQVNPVAGIKGAAQATAHPIDTLMNDANARKAIYDKAEEAFKKGDYVGGSAHLLYSLTPLLGPSLDKAGEQFKAGDIAGGAGASTGMGLNLAGPGALKDLKIPLPAKVAAKASDSAAELYQSALKPSTTLSAGEKAAVVKTGLENAIPVSKGGLEKLGGLIDDVNSKMDAAIPANSPATVNKFAVASRLSDVADRFRTQVNPTSDLEAVGKSGNEFLDTQPGQIPAKEAAGIKSGTYQQLKSKAYGELQTAAKESQKALARGIKEELIQQFPELKDLGIQDQKLLGLEPELERAVNRIGNHQVIGIGTPAAATGVGIATGSAKLAAVAATVKAVLDNPFVKSKLAIALNKAGAAKGITLPVARARLQGYINALGEATSSAGPTEGQGQ